ncbi:unnamed protein product [Mytilus coruscus]|uniref:Uncharacterized protein n=1 Tax=Mytilus coruscus TaxID=42192 RepID=A0A6J8C255_MYTCO|nr:unnamed protein product [Mytilus coruscus]
MDGNNCPLLADGCVIATGSLSVDGISYVRSTDMEHEGPAQKQHQEEKHRSCEASKQMLYEVYTNAIGILEEFEKRELKNTNLVIQRSNVKIPDQSHKKDQDVQVILQTQILILETQMKTCLSSIRDTVSEDLKQKTLQWFATRHKNEVPMSSTDDFVVQIFDVLSQKETKHPEKFKQLPGAVPNVSLGNIEQVVIQQCRIGFVDYMYAGDKEEAKVPDIRIEDVNLGNDRLNTYRKKISSQPKYEKPRWGYVSSDSVL